MPGAVLPHQRRSGAPCSRWHVTAEHLFAGLRAAGMSEVPARFSVATVWQEIPDAILAEIESFIRVFDRVTSRSAWRKAVSYSRVPGKALMVTDTGITYAL